MLVHYAQDLRCGLQTEAVGTAGRVESGVRLLEQLGSVVWEVGDRSTLFAVTRADVPHLWNLMRPLSGTSDGSFYFDNFAKVLDQLLIDRNMITHTAAIHAHPDTVAILRFPGDDLDRYLPQRPFHSAARASPSTGTATPTTSRSR
jgi:hypothetical protein